MTCVCPACKYKSTSIYLCLKANFLHNFKLHILYNGIGGNLTTMFDAAPALVCAMYLFMRLCVYDICTYVLVYIYVWCMYACILLIVCCICVSGCAIMIVYPLRVHMK